MGSDPLASFNPATRAWFETTFRSPTRAQELAWPAIAAGENALVLAPTGSGKTLAAFLAAIDRLMFSVEGAKPPRTPKPHTRIVYVSPLKALAVDIERNLREPLVGIMRQAQRLGVPYREPTVAIRTGDTPSRERARFQRGPADIFITTPESLYLVLTSLARDALRETESVIVDEIHAVVPSKRGSHLALTLERLEELRGPAGIQSAPRPLQRIGLSATQRPLDEIARFLGGLDDAGVPRPVRVLDAGRRKALQLTVDVPVEDMARLGEPAEIPSGPVTAVQRSSIWPAIHPRLLELIRAHRSTLIFVNSRRLAERLAAALNELAGRELVRAHHGSIAREQRLQIEDELKSGRLPALVATSSLELGIDMGAIDLVIQVESPPSVASGMQRIGRAGHRIDEPSTGVIVPKYRGDLLASAAITEGMIAGAVEPLRYPRNPLDILAQQIVAMASMDEWRVDDLERVVRRAAPFAELPRGAFEGVLDMLSGRYPSDEFAELRPRIVWDRTAGIVRSREGAKVVAISNGGTIPDRGLYGVFLAGAEKGKGRVGELDEEMVFEIKEGDVFLLGASSWRVEEITNDRVLVSPAPGVPGRMPFWHGENPGRPFEFGRAIGALARRMRSLAPDEATAELTTKHALAEGAARNLLQYLREQEAATGAVPDDRTIVIERYLDDMGDWRVCILSHFGAPVHAPWAMAIGAMVRARSEDEPDILWTNDGIVVRFPATDQPPPVELLLPDPDAVGDLVQSSLAVGGGGARAANLGAPTTALFAARFRENAARALLLPRRRPGQRAPLWQQRKRAGDLLAVASRYEAFPIVLETYREVLQDVFDMPGLIELLAGIRSRKVRVVTVDTRAPSPFAASLLFNYVANFMYEGDAPLAELRAQALTVDPSQLRALLGEVELRELLDQDAVTDLELALQHLTRERAARHPDGTHEMLLRLGDLTPEEIAARAADQSAYGDWISELVRERRALEVRIAGERRLIAIEDAGRYRDALGVGLPLGLPAAFLESDSDPLASLVRRYARTHGPFTTSDVARRFGLADAPVAEALRRLADAGTVVEGQFRPGFSEAEWADTGVLRTLRGRSLARLRREVEPVDQDALGRFAVAWHGIDAPERGEAALLDAIAKLEGAFVPASDLESRILPARVAKYDPRDLDALLGSGEVMWMGGGALGPKDGKVALFLAEHFPLLRPSPETRPDRPIHDRLREILAQRGASFFPQLLAAARGGFAPELGDALWDLVWAGEVTNDTLHAVRALIAPLRRSRRGGSRTSSVGRAMHARSLQRFTVRDDVAGRWSLTSTAQDAQPTTTERTTAHVSQLLERHGVVTRETVRSEGMGGGFAAAYGVLKAMEDAGRIRRGYFVAGLGAAQFALPGAVDRLRSARERAAEAQSAVLAATDPANLYGAALPWPERPEGRRPMRTAGSLVILVDGRLAGWLGRGEEQLLTFISDEADAERTGIELARALAGEVGPDRRSTLFIETVDGTPVDETPLADALREAGFARTPRGYLKRVARA
ncbi:MAG TPA: crosslink repair DNA glycosylase YcaQ family protein [Candidatus Limnocylindria bacterium]|nr:crosslink repair DNA glycosylase YcaQ family protein [Candidatus Limnocylindria bacterium]